MMSDTTLPDLPEIVGVYLRLASATSAADADRIAECFREDEVITNEEQIHTGRDAIRRRWAGPANTYQYSIEIAGGHPLGPGRYVVFTQLEGNFPGGMARLAERFTVRDGLIAELEIVPAEAAGDA
jgi:hypothetical protein